MNKGFTLIELLAVLAILGVIAVIAAVSGLSILNDSKENLYKEQEEMIEKAAKNYQLATGFEGTVNLDTLANAGYLDSSDLTNPKTGKKICATVDITYDESRNQYNFAVDITETSGACTY